jgi:hypothetical protein
VWAADDAIHEHDRLGSMSLDELGDAARDVEIGTDIGLLRKPALQRICLRAFSRDDPNGDLRRLLVVWAVEGYGGYGITMKAAARLFLQWPERLVEQVLNSSCLSV